MVVAYPRLARAEHNCRKRVLRRHRPFCRRNLKLLSQESFALGKINHETPQRVSVGMREENSDGIARNHFAKTSSNRSKEVTKLQFRDQFVGKLEQQPQAVLAAPQGFLPVFDPEYPLPWRTSALPGPAHLAA